MTAYLDLYEALDAAYHSVSYCHHLMVLDSSDATIRGYEQALAYAAAIRAKIGARHDADMANRAMLAAL